MSLSTEGLMDEINRIREENAQLRALLGKAATVAKVCSRAAVTLRMAAEDGAMKDEHVRGFMVGVAQCLEDPESVELGISQGGET